MISCRPPAASSAAGHRLVHTQLAERVPSRRHFGFVALSRIKRLGQRGRGLAIAGLVLSGLWIVVAVIAVVVANVGKATRSSATGQISHSGQLNAFSLQVGDCFDNPAGAASIKTLTAIPCSQPRNAQIFAKFKLTGSAFSCPGSAAIERLATRGEGPAGRAGPDDQPAPRPRLRPGRACECNLAPACKS